MVPNGMTLLANCFRMKPCLRLWRPGCSSATPPPSARRGSMPDRPTKPTDRCSGLRSMATCRTPISRRWPQQLHCDESNAGALGASRHITPERFGTVQRHYIRCTQDRAVPVAGQDHMIASVDGSHRRQDDDPHIGQQPLAIPVATGRPVEDLIDIGVRSPVERSAERAVGLDP